MEPEQGNQSGTPIPLIVDQPWSNQVLLGYIAVAINVTSTHPQKRFLSYVLAQLEDIEARLKDGETLSGQYRRSLFFDVVAVRELDDVAETDAQYLNLLSEFAAAIDIPCP